jgi:small multidrug resistance pump
MDTGKNKSLVLKMAGLYNISWGAFTVLFPNKIFEWTQLPLPQYPEIWQCVGMIVGVYGVGYWIAGNDYEKHWVIVLVGFLGKVFGPIGFGKALYDQTFNMAFGMQIIFNDLIWWVPFGYILYKVWRKNNGYANP